MSGGWSSQECCTPNEDSVLTFIYSSVVLLGGRVRSESSFVDCRLELGWLPLRDPA